jgi:hypothetical protein
MNYTVECGGERFENIPQADVMALADQLYAKHGVVPQIAPVETKTVEMTPVIQATVQALNPVTSVPLRPQTWIERSDASYVKAESKARIEADMDAAKASGFAPAKPLFAAGTLLIPDGVERGHSLRQEFEKKPLIDDAMSALIEEVASENRRGIEIEKTSLRMTSAGRVALADGRRFQIEDRAFKSLVRRLGLPGGASSYLSECWPELRAKNVNNWQDLLTVREMTSIAEAAAEKREVERERLVLRARGENTIYAAVSDSYTEFDVDKLALAVKRAMPPQARAEVKYDGYRTKIDVLFHSTVAPEEFGAGEYFRAGITLRTDDTGGGSVTGWSTLEQNLCLNILITSRQAQPIFRVSHIGSVEALAARIRDGLARAEESLAHFLQQWGYARRDDVMAAAIARGELVAGMSASEVFAALANGVIEREMVPVRGRREDVVKGLVRAWDADVSDDGPKSGTVTRAGLVNAFTRWAHEGQDNQFFADDVQIAASQLLWPAGRGTTPAVIPAIPLTA